MSGPLIFISHSKVKHSMLPGYQAQAADATDLVESRGAKDDRVQSSTPRRTAPTSSTVQVHPDAESLDLHLKIFFDKLQEKAFATLDSLVRSTSTAPLVLGA